MMTVLLLFYLFSCAGVNTSWLGKGEYCSKRDGTAGTCQHFTKCTSAAVEIAANGRPEICSFDGMYPVVCCKSENSTNKVVSDSLSQLSSSRIDEKNQVLKERGEKCTRRDGAAGICTYYLDCPSAKRVIKKNGRLDICFYEEIYPIVCCVNSTDTFDEYVFLPADDSNKVLTACRNFHDTGASRNAQTEFPVIGGRNSIAKENPYMAALGYGSPENIQWQCGGSLISLEFVLTAAHCLQSRTLGKVQFVRLGDLDLRSTTDDAEPQDFTVKETYPHPNYTTTSSYHDIALIRLDRPARQTDYVKPACLPLRVNLSETYPSTAGWGLTSRGGDSASILQVGFLKFLPHETCKKIYGRSAKLKEGILEEFQVCANGRWRVTDTCQGDSGGPVRILNVDYDFGNFQEIVGITSFGKECGLTAGVYTRVQPYIPWIMQIVWPNL